MPLSAYMWVFTLMFCCLGCKTSSNENNLKTVISSEATKNETKTRLEPAILIQILE